jgi:hypothetical protein
MDYWTRLNVEESSRVAKTNWRAKEGKKTHTHTHTRRTNERTHSAGPVKRSGEKVGGLDEPDFLILSREVGKSMLISFSLCV